ncbi:hypothetical protein ACOAKC_01160 [Hathewaya histolytica]|uniref:hypothetical protein n=1 Tax=Hathewaya histolytica TaxID=1498 RepID=UPI003B67BCC0
MAKYRKKPVVIEAFQFGVDSMPDWFLDNITCNNIKLYNMGKIYPQEGYCKIETLEGTMIAKCGDYIIAGVDGEIYPCKPNIFKKTYELVN